MRRLWCWRVRQRGEERIRQRRRRMVWQEQIGQRHWRRRLIWQRQRQRSKEWIRQRRLWNLRRRMVWEDWIGQRKRRRRLIRQRQRQRQRTTLDILLVIQDLIFVCEIIFIQCERKRIHTRG